jgi:N-acetylglucosamine kinase-like BadF-type ATPase
MQIALQAAFGEGPGVIVIAGTGSIAYGRDAQGKTARAGGWGFSISDEGSAHWIGRTAIASILRKVDELGPVSAGPQASKLFQEISSIWHVESTEELARAANQGANFSELLIAVAAAGDAGDELAEKVLEQAGMELAQLAGIVLLRLFSEDSSQIHVALAGGVFRYAKASRESFCNEIFAGHPCVSLSPEIIEPVHGALQLARDSA